MDTRLGKVLKKLEEAKAKRELSYDELIAVRKKEPGNISFTKIPTDILFKDHKDFINELISTGDGSLLFIKDLDKYLTETELLQFLKAKKDRKLKFDWSLDIPVSMLSDKVCDAIVEIGNPYLLNMLPEDYIIPKKAFEEFIKQKPTRITDEETLQRLKEDLVDSKQMTEAEFSKLLDNI